MNRVDMMNRSNPMMSPPDDSAILISDLRGLVEGTFQVHARSLVEIQGSLTDLILEPDLASGILWVVMRPSGRPSFTLRMLHDFLVLFSALRSLPSSETASFQALVYRSDYPGVFNRGGDLPLFLDCITRGDTDLLRLYAQACALMSFQNRNFPMLPLVTIALIQGDALGGGFEAALSCDILFAERSSLFGFPEVLFNLFPGMGAITYLTRKIGVPNTERLIVGGEHFSGEQMRALGAVDYLAEDGQGRADLEVYVGKMRRKFNAWSGFHRGRRISDPVDFSELSKIADIWVERASTITPPMLRRMVQIIRMQDAKLTIVSSETPPRPMAAE